MELKSRLDALKAGSGPPEDPAHARIDAALRSLAAEELDAIGRVLERWVQAGHAPSSAPEPGAVQPDDTGNIIDPTSQTLIALPQEWAVYRRVHAALRGDRP